MPKTHLRRILQVCMLFFAILAGKAQETNTAPTVTIISYIEQLQLDFDVKFSYADEDLDEVYIQVPTETTLEGILHNIAIQTQLKIQKLNKRYYALSKSSTIDICAIVLDNFEKNTVTGASIEVLESGNATITNPDGSFFIGNVPRNATIRIQHLGFKTRYVPAEELAGQNPCKTILLAIFYQQLEEVIVFKFLTAGLTRELDASILLNTNDFGILPGLTEPDVLQTVQALPGIKSIDETVSDINIRGGTHDQNLILWDGIKMYQSGHFFGLISAFNPYLTDKVTLIKNGTSAQYSDGVSGIIAMETRNEIEAEYFGGAGFNLISGDFYGHVPLGEKLAFQFSARRSVTDFLNTPTYNQFRNRVFQDSDISDTTNPPRDSGISQDENFYFYDFTGKVLYDFNDKHHARLSFIQINNTLDYTETTLDSGMSDISGLNQDNISLGLQLDDKWSGKFSSQLHSYYTNYNLDSRSITENGAQQLLQKNKVVESSFKLNTTYSLSDKVNWLNGYQFSEVGIANFTDVTRPAFNSNVKGLIRTHAVYSELGYISRDQKFRTRVGGRFQNIENPGTFTKFIAEPRLNINYTVANHFRLEVLGEFKNQTTNQVIDLEQNFLGIEKRRWLLSDDSLLPVTQSKQTSMGLTYDKDTWYASVEGFFKNVKGVSTSTQGFQNQNQFNGEIGEYDAKGLEFIINHKSNYFSTWASYTHNINTYTFGSITPSQFPNNLDIRHALAFASTFTYEKLKLGIGVTYRTGKPITKPLEGSNAINTGVFPNEINYQDPNSSRLPDYLRADASAIYDFDLGPNLKASAGISLLNILNKDNILNTYYRLNSSNEIETVESLSLGRTPNISFRVSF